MNNQEKYLKLIELIKKYQKLEENIDNLDSTYSEIEKLVNSFDGKIKLKLSGEIEVPIGNIINIDLLYDYDDEDFSEDFDEFVNDLIDEANWSTLDYNLSEIFPNVNLQITKE